MIQRASRRYWAVGLNFDYDIIALKPGETPDSMEYGSIEGPFKDLNAARRQAREWIKSDRDHLSDQLRQINERLRRK